MERKPTFTPGSLPPARRKYVANFLRSWINWAEAGGHPGELPFKRSDGLCIAALRWDDMMKPCDPMKADVPQIDIANLAVRQEFEWQFRGGEIPSSRYPFDAVLGSDVRRYSAESRAGECHLNPQRRAWAKAYLEALETYK